MSRYYSSGDEIVVHERYSVGTKLGRGSFGMVYKGTDLKTGTVVALKLEPVNSDHAQLAWEYKIYRSLECKNSTRFPEVYWYGESHDLRVLVMELMGPDLMVTLVRDGPCADLRPWACQMLDCVRKLHEGDHVHRDLKPENFVVDAATRQHVRLLDFGLARPYRNGRGKHIKLRNARHVVGTRRYASVHSHHGVEQSRRDDLESLAYIWAYILRGSVPWQGLHTRRELMTAKAQTVPEELFRGHPVGFAHYLRVVRDYGFAEPPDYDYLEQLLCM